MKELVNTFQLTDAHCIRKAQKLLEDTNIIGNLSFIDAHYTFLSKSIEDLQQAGASLSQILQILDNVEEKINLVGEDVGLRIKEKFVFVIQKNPNLDQMKLVLRVLRGQAENVANIHLTPQK